MSSCRRRKAKAKFIQMGIQRGDEYEDLTATRKPCAQRADGACVDTELSVNGRGVLKLSRTIAMQPKSNDVMLTIFHGFHTHVVL